MNGENSFGTDLHFNDAGREHLWSRVWDSICAMQTLENVLGAAFLRHDTARGKHCSGKLQQWRLIHLPNGLLAFASLYF